MKSKIIDMAVIFVLVAAVIGISDQADIVNKAVKSSRDKANPLEEMTVVLDPGHGGIDGGAVAADGTCEKDINLNIALKLKTLLEAEGINVIMTREHDVGLYEENTNNTSGTISSLKAEDIYQRKKIIDNAGADLVIGIHLNSFTQDPDVKGAQVFYPEADACGRSLKAAEIIQKDFNKNINTDKKRTALAKSDIYVFKNPVSPIVIAECGFLSNEDDLEALKRSDFQEKISKSLKASICKYLSGIGNKTQ
ncbi:MAG: N-acetylmuramoyl-L-alanine amidase [Bacillota bacterium]|nr:N-acetylmuramoyl-L-alanine amidase [Bacillota bacterium]